MSDEVVPTIDDLERLAPHEEPQATYRDWTPDQTRVITYTTNPEKYRKDIACASLDWARDHCRRVYGRILEENVVPASDPERFFFRVYRPLVTFKK